MTEGNPVAAQAVKFNKLVKGAGANLSY